jgi:transposase
MPAARKYPEELKGRATRLAVDARRDASTRRGAIVRIAGQLDIHPEPSLRGGPPVEVRGGLDLGHDVLDEASADTTGPRWQVPGEEHGGGRQPRVPVVLADGLEEHAHADDGVLLAAC